MITAILARNEADRYLDRVVRHHRKWGPVLVLDDHSTDNTADVARKAGATVREMRGGEPMWGRESDARKRLWDWGAQVAGSDWLFIADADHLLVGDPRPLCTSWVVNTWAMPLFDCWDREDQYRADGYWQGYQHPRPWLFRPAAVPEGWTADWSSRGIHCGHCPASWPGVIGRAPESIYILHLGWTNPEHRREKYRKYRSQWDQLSPFEREHVQSILDT